MIVVVMGRAVGMRLGCLFMDVVAMMRAAVNMHLFYSMGMRGARRVQADFGRDQGEEAESKHERQRPEGEVRSHQPV